uniref:non-specific serine/threonine protein kinase n=1 Tax=Syphacia muris TaxID=451379 RepID=A0A0N5AYC9_9BILA
MSDMVVAGLPTANSLLRAPSRRSAAVRPSVTKRVHESQIPRCRSSGRKAHVDSGQDQLNILTRNGSTPSLKEMEKHVRVSTCIRTASRERREQTSSDTSTLINTSVVKESQPIFTGTSNVTENCQTHVSANSSNLASPMPSTSFRCSSVSKAKRVRFYRNGDQYFKGIWYAISPERVRSFQALLCDLTRSLSDSANLPHGVRFVFTLDGSRKIKQLEDFSDGEGYVCSSSDVYKRVDYENAREPTWCTALTERVVAPFRTDSPFKQEPNDFVHPRIITVIRNGIKPRRVFRHLLNKKTARSYLQVIQDITSLVKLDSGAVRKIFAISGKEVTCLADFFLEDYVFIAYGKERMSVDDFYIVTEGLYLKYLYFIGFVESKRLCSTRAQNYSYKPKRRSMPQRNESLRDDRKGSLVQDSEMSRKLPLFLDDMIHIVKLIGDGNTALVYETICKKSRERKALKVISRENAKGKEDLIRSEIAIMQRISHDNIVRMDSCWHFEGAYYLSLELVPEGDLFEHLCRVKRVCEKDAASLMNCLASALDYLHTLNIVHRDVKPENLLVYECPYTRNLQLKLADFGLAVEMTDQPLMVICGTPTYVAPEVLSEFGYDNKVDLWAAGVILYVLLCGFPPFQSTDGNQEQLFEQIIRGQFSFPSPVWKNISYSAKGLIQGLLQLDIEERFSASQVLSFPWIQGVGEVDPEYERLMEAAVKAHAQREGFRDCLEENNLELFFSRRTSMNGLSEYPEDSSDGSRRDSSFDFYPAP